MAKVKKENPTFSPPVVLSCRAEYEQYAFCKLTPQVVIVLEVDEWEKSAQEIFDHVFGNAAGYKSESRSYYYGYHEADVWMWFEGEALELLHQYLHVNDIPEWK